MDEKTINHAILSQSVANGIIDVSIGVALDVIRCCQAIERVVGVRMVISACKSLTERVMISASQEKRQIAHGVILDVRLLLSISK